MNARNVRRIDFALYKIDMTRDVRFTSAADEDEGEGEGDAGHGFRKSRLAGRTPVKSWSKNIDDSEAHKPYSEQVRIEGKLPVGAYLLEAKSGSLSVRDVVLVTDATLVLKSSANQALVFFADAMTGAPIANANVALWESYYRNNKWHWRRLRQTTDTDGLARFALRSVNDYRNLFATAASNDRQAFAAGQCVRQRPNKMAGAFMLSPIGLHIVRKKRCNGSSSHGSRVMELYSTPANQVVEYEITDPRGTKSRRQRQH